MLRRKYPSTSHRCWAVGGYLCVVQLTRREGEKNTPRTIVPEDSNASEWFSHRVDIEVGEERWKVEDTEADKEARCLYAASSKTVSCGSIFAIGAQRPKSWG